ncbi:MAG: ABC transporter permease, partial [Actinobacteria bacterium]|nr:ABC transporter permease [Actinomycetota bacterium]
VVTTTAAVLPAFRATRVTAMGGMVGVNAELGGSGRRRGVLGTSVLLTGVAVLLMGVVGGVRPAALVTLGATASLLGLAVLMPLMARPAARALGAPWVRLFGEPSALGRENAIRNPRRTAAAASALTIGIGLIGFVAILAGSMKASAAKAVENTLRADFVVKAQGTPGLTPGVPPVVAERLRQSSEVDVVSEIRAGQWGRGGQAETLLAIDPQTVTQVHQLDSRSAAAARSLDDRSVLVRESVARLHGWQAGDAVPMTFARTGTQRMRLADTFTTTAVRDDYVISNRAFEANYAQQLDAEVRVVLAPGVSPDEGRRRLQNALADFPNVDLMNRAEVLAAQDEQVERLLVPITALLALSVLIALLGIANTLALSIHERTGEIGLLRAIGMARSQLRSMIRSEAVIIASLGATVGLAVAMFSGCAAVAALGDVGVTELVFPLRQLLGWAAAATAAGLIAGVLPARRAARLGALEAVAHG